MSGDGFPERPIGKIPDGALRDMIRLRRSDARVAEITATLCRLRPTDGERRGGALVGFEDEGRVCPERRRAATGVAEPVSHGADVDAGCDQLGGE